MAAHLPKTATMRAVRQSAHGAAESLSVQRNLPLPEKGLQGNFTLIKVKSAALNRADLLMRSGRYPNQNGRLINLGLEVAGTDVETGQPVMALLASGGYSEYVYAPKEQVMPVPGNLEIFQAAAIPEVWLTAWQLLTFVAKVEVPEDLESACKEKSLKTVLIHGGASGVGTAASQLCSKILGYKVITTVGSCEKQQASKNYGASHSLNYKTDPNWETKVKELTNNKGADIILDCIGGSYFEKNLEALAVDGKWVLYGFLGGPKFDTSMATKFLPKLLGKRGSLLASLLNSRPASYKAELVEDFSKRVLPKFDDQTLIPVIDCVYDIEKVVEAHSYMESNKNIGKILLEFDYEESS